MTKSVDKAKKRAANLEHKEPPEFVERKQLKPEPKPYFPPPPKIDEEQEAAAQEVEDKPEDVDSDFTSRDIQEIKELLNPYSAYLDTEDRIKQIESRCEELDISAFFSTGEIRQKVPVVPGQFEPIFRTVSVEEDMGIKKLILEDDGPAAYLEDKLSLYATVLSVVSIGDKKFTSHLNKRKFDEKLFLKKANEIWQLPLQIFADIQIQRNYFNRRVFKLIVDGSLKKS